MISLKYKFEIYLLNDKKIKLWQNREKYKTLAKRIIKKFRFYRLKEIKDK